MRSPRSCSFLPPMLPALSPARLWWRTAATPAGEVSFRKAARRRHTHVMATRAGLIIFDCDGVLVDSEPLAMRILLATISEAGGNIDAATAYKAFLGKSLASICEQLRSNYGLDLGATALDRMRGRLYAAIRQ